jgi:RES domain-containing protein
MTVTAWRIVQAMHQEDAFSGEGARLYGGRWNSKGTPVIYTSGSIALAALELLVNLPSPKLLEAFVRIPVNFPPEFIKMISPSELPKDWRDHPISPSTREMGDQWIRENSSVVLQIPSVVIPEEFNYLLNPTHPNFTKVQIGQALGYQFDSRLSKIRP